MCGCDNRPSYLLSRAVRNKSKNGKRALMTVEAYDLLFQRYTQLVEMTLTKLMIDSIWGKGKIGKPKKGTHVHGQTGKMESGEDGNFLHNFLEAHSTHREFMFLSPNFRKAITNDVCQTNDTELNNRRYFEFIQLYKKNCPFIIFFPPCGRYFF